MSNPDEREVVFYGASDDRVEFDGYLYGEFDAYGPWWGRLEAPNGESLILTAEFSKPGYPADWTLGVANSSTWPGWPIRFTERPDREGDPAITISVPKGTQIVGYS